METTKSPLLRSIGMALMFAILSNCNEGDELIPLPATGDTKASDVDGLIVDGSKVQFTDNPYHGDPSIHWQPGDYSTWYVRLLGVVPGGTTLAVPVSGCMVYISGSVPPTETTTYSLKRSFTALAPGEAHITYFTGIVTNDPGVATNWLDYSSINGQMQMIVSSGKLVVSFSNIDVQTEDGLYSHKLSGQFTCKVDHQ